MRAGSSGHRKTGAAATSYREAAIPSESGHEWIRGLTNVSVRVYMVGWIVPLAVSELAIFGETVAR